MSGDLNPEQKRDREGFVAGLQIAKAARESAGAPSAAGTKPAELSGSDAAHLRAQAMPLADRMKLAEGRRLRRRMMAGRGQRDCGQGEYTCRTYWTATFLKRKDELN